MKKEITYIDGARFEAILTAKGLVPVPQAGFMKVSGAKGRNLYIAKTKKVGRVDLSGFEAPAEMGIRNLGGEKFGAVTQQLRFDLPENEVLANFELVLIHMLSLPAREIEKKSTTAKPKTPKATGWTTTATTTPDEEKAARLALIQKVAAEKGVKVSKKALQAPVAQAEQA